MVSVIVPIYKVEKYLEKCIESIRNQTYQQLEIILVDDGSPDNCGEICDKYQIIDSRIKVIHKTNGGLSDARNAGLEVASGQYILFVDSDDYIHPQMVEILYQNIQLANADISVCDFIEVGEVEKISFQKVVGSDDLEIFEATEVMNQLQSKNLLTVVAWNKLYKREIFHELRYPKGRIHEDEFVVHHILHQCKKSVYTKDRLYYYVQRHNSITGLPRWENVMDGWDAYEDRLRLLHRNHYNQMILETKIQMLHYIFVYYKKIYKIREAKEFVAYLYKNFKAIYKEEGVRIALDREVCRKYKYIVISPRLYYNSKDKYDKWCECWNNWKHLIRERIKA